MSWQGAARIESLSYTCGYCGNLVASATGFFHKDQMRRRVYICPHCEDPSYMYGDRQFPRVPPGNDVKALPREVESLYKEARNCVVTSAYTGAVLLCRKLLMNTAVAQGAKPGLTFQDYVQFLADGGYVPPNGKGWVDHIRKKGNEAAHEIAPMSAADAVELIGFLEMLLKFIYEFPSRVPSGPSA